MSVLSFPRLYLRGLVSWDPVVSNNDPAVYDGLTARAVFQPGETADGFRRRMIATTEQRGDWNYFGTHRGTFERVRITGGTEGPGIADVHGDPLVSAPVELLGKLVDIDPTGIVSQIFFDELTVGVPGRAHLRARPRRRMSSRWLNFGRNLTQLPIAGSAAAAWQAVFPSEDVEIIRADESALLAQLAGALGDGSVRGLMLRLCTYRTQYFRNGVLNSLPEAADLAALQRLHEQGAAVSNPAYSELVGVLGLWVRGDSETTLSGRHLFGVPLPHVHDTQGRPVRAGPVAVEFHPDTTTLSVDLSNTVPELDGDLAKLALGAIEVSVTAGGNPTPLGRIQPASYDRAAYQARAGIVDLDVSAVPDVGARLAAGTLSLTVAAPSGPAVLAAERVLTAFCDDCNVYLDQDEPRILSVTVRERGAVPTRPLSVLVAEYPADMTPVVGTTVLPVSADGTVQLTVTGTAPGYRHFGFTVFPTGTPTPQPPPALSAATAQFASIRTLPFDDALAALPDSALSWELIFATILSNYHALTPRMSTIIDLSDPDAVRTFAARVREVTSAELFESARYMPVTRDLSRGKRAVLHRYCDLVLGDAAAPNLQAAPGESAPLPGVPEGVTFAKRGPR